MEELQLDLGESIKLFKRYEFVEQDGIVVRYLYLVPIDIPLTKLQQQQQ